MICLYVIPHASFHSKIKNWQRIFIVNNTIALRRYCFLIYICLYWFCVYVLKSQTSRGMFTAHYCVPPHCTDFTDMDLTACGFFWFCEHYRYFILLLCRPIMYYVLCICYHVMVKIKKIKIIIAVYNPSVRLPYSVNFCSRMRYSRNSFKPKLSERQIMKQIVTQFSNLIWNSDYKNHCQYLLVSISTTFENCVIIRVSPIHILSLSHSTPCPEKRPPPPK